MFKKNSSLPEELSSHPSITSIIGPSVKVEGEFSGQGNLKIEGNISGKIFVENSIEISTGARVNANIEAEKVKIAGRVKGNIKAKKEVILLPSANVRGDIAAQKIAVELGAKLNGKCTIQDEEVEKKKEIKSLKP